MKRCKVILLFIFLVTTALPVTVYADREEITYQAELDYPPYKYIQNGYLTGFDIDLTSSLFKKQDYLIHYSTGQWDVVDKRLRNGEIDTTGLMVVTEERRKSILFSKTVMKSHISVYSRQSLKEDIKLSTLANYTIGVGSNQYSEDILRNKVGISRYLTYPTVTKALVALQKGEIDLLFENQEVVDYLIVEQGITSDIIRKIDKLYPMNVAYGISKSSPNLVSYINEQLDRVQQSGAFEELYKQYFFTHSDYYNEQMHSRIISGAAIGFCLLVFSIVFLKMYINYLRRAIYAEQQFFEDLIEHTGMFVWAVNADTKVIRFNKYAERMTGLREQDILGESINDIGGLEDSKVAELLSLLHKALQKDFVNNIEMWIKSEDSAGSHFVFRTTVLQGLDKRASDVFVLVGMDIDERKHSEIKLQMSYEELEAAYEELAATEEELKGQIDKLQVNERRFTLASEGSGGYMWELNWDTGNYTMSKRWYEDMGYPLHKICTYEDVLNIVHPDDQESARRARQEHLSGLTDIYETEYRMRNKSGVYVWFEVRGKAIADSANNVVHFLGSLIDISNRKQVELKLSNSYQELEATYEQLSATQGELEGQYSLLLENQDKMFNLAYYDSLSNLPNRLCLLEAMEKFFRYPGGHAALLFVDTDNFKYINDTLGHKFGDILIRKASERLQSVVREGEILSRLGGDEFVIFIQDTRNHEDVLKLAEDVLNEFKRPFLIGESNLYVTVSIGISFYPEDGITTEEILKNADVAMYRAKEEGKSRYVVYDKTMHAAFNERMNIEKHLRSAVANEEFELHYQPQIDIESGETSGVEALIRWNSPGLGFVSPLSFIKIAEDSRLIIPIGEWVLRSSCLFMKEIHNRMGIPYKISVNISVIQMLQDDFTDIVLNVLAESGLEPKCLELEITESIFMESFESIVSKLEFLKSRGICIALDDFGTGYSSLSYLQQLPISTLKMDKAFIDSLSDNTYSQAFVQTIVELGHKMGLKVVAEGVEDNGQLAFLQKSGCDKVQGYLFSKPLPKRSITEWFDAQKKWDMDL